MGSQDKTQVGQLGNNCLYAQNHLPVQPMRSLTIDWTLNIRTTVGGWGWLSKLRMLAGFAEDQDLGLRMQVAAHNYL